MPIKKKEVLCLLIHGFASGPQEMEYLNQHLSSEGYHVKNTKLLGHGTNPSELGKVKWQDWVEQIDQEVNLLKGRYKRIYIIGFSVGGLIALKNGLNPSVTGVIAISPSLYLFNKNLYLLPIKQFIRFGSFFVPYIKRNNDIYKYRNNEYKRSIYLKLPLKSVYQIMLLSDATKKILPLYTKPLLLIHASDDGVADVKGSYLIYSSVNSNDKELKIIDKGEHLITLNDARDIVFQEISRFLEIQRGIYEKK